jgi:hypothetical protein
MHTTTDFAALPIVASYGPFTIVRRDFTKRSDRLYTILDGQGRPVGKNWAFLRNARKQAAHMAAKLEAGQTVALAVLGVQS